MRNHGSLARGMAYLLCLISMLLVAGSARGQGSARPAELSGRVTADQGLVRAFRVKAASPLYRMSFTVYTVEGRYHFYNLPPGRYSVQVIEPGFESSTQNIELNPGAKATLDLALTAKPVASDVELVDYDEAYPPGPGREVLQRNCTGCHGRVAWLRYGPHTEQEWRRMVGYMFDPTQNLVGHVQIPMVPLDDLSPEDVDAIVNYFATNFGPGSKKRGLKKDPLVRDERALATAMYIEYELPDPPPGNVPEGRPRRRGLHSPVAGEDGMIYWSGTAASDSILRLDPSTLDFEARFKEWIVPSNSKYGSHPDGIVWLNGKIYFAELGGGGIGELDPATGHFKHYPTPTRGGAHSMYPDSKGNIWYTVIRGGGGRIGRLNLATGKAEDFSPVYAANYYGIIVDRQDRVWAAGLRKGVVSMYDPKIGHFTNFPTSEPGSGPRRLALDSKDRVWFTEYYAGKLATIDPASGKLTEYSYPLKNTTPYEPRADAEDNIWVTDDFYESLIKFDPRTQKFTYYPFPLTAQVDAPKMTTSRDGALWFYPRGRNSKVVESFLAAGNMPQACRPWMASKPCASR